MVSTRSVTRRKTPEPTTSEEARNEITVPSTSFEVSVEEGDACKRQIDKASLPTIDEDDGLFPSSLASLTQSIRQALQAKVSVTNEDATTSSSIPCIVKGRTSKNESEQVCKWQSQAQPENLPDDRGKNDLQASKEGGLAKQLLVPPRDPRLLAKAAARAPDAAQTAGKKWFDLPATTITDEVKRDLRLLRLRGTFDTKRFYKSYDKGQFPKYFQMGRVVDSPLEFYSSRLTQGERKESITAELLADPDLSNSRKKRYSKMQEEANKFKRVKHRKTELPRLNKKPQKVKY